MRLLSKLTVSGAMAVMVAGCAPLLDFAGPSLFNAAGRNACEPAHPSEPSAPGDWICPSTSGAGSINRPRHRVERKE